MDDNSYYPRLPSISDYNGNISSEQQDTARLLERLLGKPAADRYIDFCKLSFGSLGLRASIPMAAHALREMDSIFRETLAEFSGVNPNPSEDELTTLKEATAALRNLGHTGDALRNAVRCLQPKDTHAEIIKKIVNWLDLAEDGDIATSWLKVRNANQQVHKRKFNHSLIVDDDFRQEWAQPFDTVIRGIAVALQTKYADMMLRVSSLAQMNNPPVALARFEKLNVSAMTVQFHFYQNIEGPAWLPELINRRLVAEPLPRTPDDNGDRPYHEWPVSEYLIKMARSEDKPSHELLATVLRSISGSNHPDVRHAGLDILASLPPEVSAPLADIAVGWLTKDAAIVGFNPADQLVTRLANAKEHDACLKVASALLQVCERDGQIGSLYSRHMYENSLSKIEKAITGALGLDALRLFTRLLYEAAIIERKIIVDPFQDYTSISSRPISGNENTDYGIIGALTNAIRDCAVNLILRNEIDTGAIMDILLERRYKIFERIALHGLAKRPDSAPQWADVLLFDPALFDFDGAKHEYAELAISWFPALSEVRQIELLKIIDNVPGRRIDRFRKRVLDYEKREATADEEEKYAQEIVLDITWKWRSVLPKEHQEVLVESAARHGEPDAWRAASRYVEKSPISTSDFVELSTTKIAEYLNVWSPIESRARETKTALGAEFRSAVQADPQKFIANLSIFSDLPPFYLRRLMEGIHSAIRNNIVIDWQPVLQLIVSFVPKAVPPKHGEASVDGEDPSWFWAAKESAEVLRTGLRQGKRGISLQSDTTIKLILSLLECSVPPVPESEDFDANCRRNAYFAAESTMLGLVVELNVLQVWWLSNCDGSRFVGRLQDTPLPFQEFAAFAARILPVAGDNSRIVRAILGRYLNFLVDVNEDWTKANFDRIFFNNGESTEAAWLGHLLNDTQPARSLMTEMSSLYQREIARMKDLEATEDKEYRQDRIGDYLLIHHLWGSIAPGLLDEFWTVAPARARKHVIVSLGNEMRQGGEMPDEIRVRGMAYWEMRLSAGEVAENKENFRDELGALGRWTMDTTIAPDWLLAQMLRMLKAGYAPRNSMSVLGWAAKISSQYPDETIQLIEALLSNAHADQWAYLSEPNAIRTILEAGNASTNADTNRRGVAVINILTSKGDIGFLDLLPTAQ